MDVLAGIASISLGRAPDHNIHDRIITASQYGFQGIELFYEDIVDFARRQQLYERDDKLSAEVKAASLIYISCQKEDLTIICLQPFLQYEGLIDRDEHSRRIEEMKHWIQLANALRTELILIPSSFLPKEVTSGDRSVITTDMREIATLAATASPPIKIAYEALQWGTHIDVWEDAWDIVQRVDQDNFGICIDTFNIAGRIFADPASPTGKTDDAESNLSISLERLKHIDPSKLFFVQLADGERLSSPLTEGNPLYHKDQPARMSWSRNCRLFPGETEKGAYLPVQEIVTCITEDLGYRGWMSFEIFSKTLKGSSQDIPGQHARRAARSWTWLIGRPPGSGPTPISNELKKSHGEDMNTQHAKL